MRQRRYLDDLPQSYSASLTEGYTLLHHAARCPHLGLVRLLASRGANLNRPANTELKERPLQCAIEGGDLAVVDFLVLQGADMHAGNVKVRWDILAKESTNLDAYCAHRCSK